MEIATLCLDLGTRTGFAVHTPSTTISGTWELADKAELEEQRKKGLERRCDIRFTRLLKYIGGAIETFNIKRIIFEDVTFNTSQFQAQLWASLRAAIWYFPCEIQCVPVKTLKVFAAKNGNADKLAMRAALEDRQQIPENADDNEIDAIWLGYYTVAVDSGWETWNSVWEKKLEAKRVKTLKLATKRAKLLAAKTISKANALISLEVLLTVNNVKLTKSESVKIVSQALKGPVQSIKSFGVITSNTNNKKIITWSLNPLS